MNRLLPRLWSVWLSAFQKWLWSLYLKRPNDDAGIGSEYHHPEWIGSDSGHGVEGDGVGTPVECVFNYVGEGVVRLRKWSPCT